MKYALTLKGECCPKTMLLIGVVLLLDGRNNVDTFEMMEEEAACRVMVHVLWNLKGSEPRLHRIFIELLYELCRVQKLQRDDLENISDEFIEYLFQIVERNEDYDVDPYSYGIIRILVS